MSEQTIEKIKEICLRCSGEFDYYDILGLDKYASIEDVQKALNTSRLRVYFHPDQEAYIKSNLPQEYQNTYFSIRDCIPDMMNVFSNVQLKNNYDQSIYQEKEMYEDTEDLNEDTMDLQEEMEKYSYVAMTEEDEDIISALKTTSTKYSWDYASKALTQAMMYGNYKAFTRENDARDKVSRISIDRLKQTIARRIKKETQDISFEQASMDYITYAYQNDRELMYKISSFDMACQETVNKYGIEQTTMAIRKLTAYGDCSSFTNTYAARDNLKASAVRQTDVEFFMRIYLNGNRHDNPSYAYDNIAGCSYDQILEMYLNEKQLEKERKYNSGFTR